jgi:hypothetical protein
MHCCENLCSKGCLSMSLALLCPWSKLIFGAELTVVEGACVVFLHHGTDFIFSCLLR